MRPGQTFSVDHDPMNTAVCHAKHGEIPHERWIELEMALEAQYAAKAEPEPWELKEFIEACRSRMPPGIHIEAEIRMSIGEKPQERFAIFTHDGEDPDRTEVATFTVTPAGAEWPKMKFYVTAIEIDNRAPWEIAGPIAALARERKARVV